MGNLSLKTKLLLALLSASLGAVFITGWQQYEIAQEALKKSAINRLLSVRETKKRQIENNFHHLSNQVQIFSRMPIVIEAMESLDENFKNVPTSDSQQELSHQEVIDFYKENFLPRLQQKMATSKTIEDFCPTTPQARRLQYHYIAQNPNPIGAKEALDDAEDGSAYSATHKKYHPVLKSFLQKFGYYDVFLIDAKTGQIIYSVSKETDFGTNLLNGPYSQSGLAKAFAEARMSDWQDSVSLVDFTPYEPSYGAPAAFMATPIFKKQSLIGVLAIQVPVDEIDRVMTGEQQWEKEGMGHSGEAYIVGSDFTMRNNSRFFLEDSQKFYSTLEKNNIPSATLNGIRNYNTTILQQEVKSDAALGAIKGNSGVLTISDYRGVEVLSAFAPLAIEGVKWAVLAEIDTAEAFSPVIRLRNRVVVVGLLWAFLLIGVGLLLADMISRPLKKLADSMRAISGGDFTHKVEVKSQDEVGMLARSFNEMTDKLDQSTVSKNFFDSIVTSMTEILMVVDFSFAKSGDREFALVISRVNKACSRLLGYDEDELVGYPVEKVFGYLEDKAPFDPVGLTILTSNGSVRGVENNFITKDGDKIPVLIALALMRQTGIPTRNIVCVAQDITVLKKQEVELLEAWEKAEIASRAKSLFMANMSHQIRTPLNSINGMTYLIKNESLTPQQATHLDKVTKATNALLILVDNILNFSELDEGEFKLEDAEFKLHELQEILVQKFQRQASQKGLLFKCDIASEIPYSLIGDSQRLLQVLTMLIENALKFTEKGMVEVSAMLTREEGTRVILGFMVYDTGIGMTKAEYEKIFTPFTQVDGSSTRSYGGIGLSLALIKKIISLMHGEIKVDSTPGKGSTFTFSAHFERGSKTIDIQEKAPTNNIESPVEPMPDEDP